MKGFLQEYSKQLLKEFLFFSGTSGGISGGIFVGVSRRIPAENLGDISEVIPGGMYGGIFGRIPKEVFGQISAERISKEQKKMWRDHLRNRCGVPGRMTVEILVGIPRQNPGKIFEGMLVSMSGRISEGISK